MFVGTLDQFRGLIEYDMVFLATFAGAEMNGSATFEVKLNHWCITFRTGQGSDELLVAVGTREIGDFVIRHLECHLVVVTTIHGAQPDGSVMSTVLYVQLYAGLAINNDGLIHKAGMAVRALHFYREHGFHLPGKAYGIFKKVNDYGAQTLLQKCYIAFKIRNFIILNSLYQGSDTLSLKQYSALDR